MVLLSPWWCFLHYLPFHTWEFASHQWNSLRQSPVMWSFNVFFIVSQNKLLNKQLRCWWFEMHVFMTLLMLSNLCSFSFCSSSEDMDLVTAIDETILALNLFMNNRFSEAKKRMEPWWVDDGLCGSLPRDVLVYVNRDCHPGGHDWDCYPGALSLSQTTATRVKIGHLSMKSMGARSSNEVQRLDFMIGYQDTGPRSGWATPILWWYTKKK